jgi:tRNA (adenine57-N1/adenine58-N1)-methyltransferase catalytic subunit
LSWNLHGTFASEGDLVQLAGLKHKNFIFELHPGTILHTHRGMIQHDDLIGLAWGSQVVSHLGNTFIMLQPSLGDLIKETPRNSQIMYPKDIGYILVSMGIGPGQHVLEAGSGSGALSRAFAFSVGSGGHVTSYEVRTDMHKMARKNLEDAGLLNRVTLKLADIGNGIEEKDVDALFLDLPNPYDYMDQVRAALKPGGFFGTLLPTTNQVIRTLHALNHNHFVFTEVCEVLLRYYRTDPDRFRPTDRMVAHTGFLIFSRPVIKSDLDVAEFIHDDPDDV